MILDAGQGLFSCLFTSYHYKDEKGVFLGNKNRRAAFGASPKTHFVAAFCLIFFPSLSFSHENVNSEHIKCYKK